MAQALNELTEFDISPRMKKRLVAWAESLDKIAGDLGTISKIGGIIGILSLAIALNIRDAVRIARATRFTKV